MVHVCPPHPGNWTVLFDALGDTSVDLLANEITDEWHWDRWPFTTRISDELTPFLTHIYMPIIRYSRRMLALLDESYAAGLVGYCEMAQVTLPFAIFFGI